MLSWDSRELKVNGNKNVSMYLITDKRIVLLGSGSWILIGSSSTVTSNELEKLPKKEERMIF
jgi:hypothetical protein